MRCTFLRVVASDGIIIIIIIISLLEALKEWLGFCMVSIGFMYIYAYTYTYMYI